MIIKSLKNLIIGGLMLFFFTTGFIFLPAVGVNAQTYNFASSSGLNTAADKAGYDVSPSATSLEAIISTAIYTLLSLVGVIFFGLLIYGGFTWMTAQGNEERVKGAMNTIINALLGLIVTLAAYTLSYFLIHYFWE